MATKKVWGYGDDTSLGRTPLDLKQVDPVSHFALVEDEPDSCSLINNNSDVDLGEKLTYNCRTIPNVASGLDNMNPPKVRTGVQYQVKLDEQLSVRDTENPSFREDLPITAYITIRHPKNGNIKPADVDKVFARLVASCLKGTDSSGNVSTRFGDLMKSALRPTMGLGIVSSDTPAIGYEQGVTGQN